MSRLPCRPSNDNSNRTTLCPVLKRLRRALAETWVRETNRSATDIARALGYRSYRSITRLAPAGRFKHGGARR